MASITKTFRLTNAQAIKLGSESYKDKGSFLIRELLRIYFESPLPGQDILKLKQEFSKKESKVEDEVIAS